MIRKILFATILAAISVQAFGQDSIPAGGYINSDEYKIRIPKYSDTFTLIRRTTGDIKAWGGNDYKVESSEEQITEYIGVIEPPITYCYQSLCPFKSNNHHPFRYESLLV